MVRVLRIVAAVEATTLLALIAATIVHRGFDGHDWTPTLGPIHGLVFVAYAALAVHIGTDQHWPPLRTTVVVFAAVLPAGGYLVAERLTRTANG